MLDFDVGKLVVIGLVALIVIGPKDLPRVLRQVGQLVGKMRRMANEFQSQFMEAMREADVEELKKEVQSVADAAKVDVAFDPIRDVKEQLTAAVEGEKTVEAPRAAEPEDPSQLHGPHAEEIPQGSTESPNPEERLQGASRRAAEKTQDPGSCFETAASPSPRHEDSGLAADSEPEKAPAEKPAPATDKPA